MTKKWEKLLLMGFILFATVGCDQATKRMAERHLAGAPVRSMLHDTVRLQYAENTGAFLGFGQRFSNELKRWLFLILPIVTVAGMLFVSLFSHRLSRGQVLCLTLLAAGGLGNLLDRMMLNGKVTDFMNIGMGSLRTGIFNVADVAIMVGVFGLVITQWWKSHQEQLIAEHEQLLIDSAPHESPPSHDPPEGS